MMSKDSKSFCRRKNRVRTKLRLATKKGGVRLSVFRSNCHIYAQVIDDNNGKTLVAMSTLDTELRDKLKGTGNKTAAEEVGKHLARRALKAGIQKVVFDRGAYLYHGRVEALAMGARAEGLEF